MAQLSMRMLFGLKKAAIKQLNSAWQLLTAPQSPPIPHFGPSFWREPTLGPYLMLSECPSLCPGCGNYGRAELGMENCPGMPKQSCGRALQAQLFGFRYSINLRLMTAKHNGKLWPSATAVSSIRAMV